MAFRRLHQAFKHLRSPANPVLRRLRQHRRSATHGLGGYVSLSRFVDQLEERRLLTTVHGGDVFDFRQSTNGEDSLVRVKLQGNITAELIGAKVNRRDNSISIVNLPGLLNDQPVNGGVDPGLGIQFIGPLSVNPPSGGTPPINNPNISALAAAGANSFYALNSNSNAFQLDPNTGQFQQGTAVQIVLLTLPPADGLGQITGVANGTIVGTIFTPNGAGNPGLPLTATGADVAPNGDLFFVGNTAAGAIGLFSVRPSVADAGTATDEVAQSLNFYGNVPVPPAQGQQQNPTVSTITFVGNNLFGVITGSTTGGTQASGSQLVEIDQASGNIIGGPTDITIPQQGGGGGTGGNVGTIVGLDVDSNGNVIGIESGDTGRVLQINTADATAFNLGAIGDNDVGGTETARGLAFVPGVRDPFTGRTTGAFIGIDGSDQLFFVNAEDRNPAQYLYNVYVTDSDLTGEISIGFVRDIDDEDGPNFIQPIDGPGQDFRVLPVTQPRSSAFVAPGGAFIGAVSVDIQDQAHPQDDGGLTYPAQPIPSDIDFGTLPSDVTTLSAGLVVDDGNDLGKFLLGGTIMGEVDVRGSMDLFYAGWVVTGDANSQSALPSDNPNNFNVNGDLRDLLTRNPLGSNGDEMQTGFDLRVGGTLGQVRNASSEFRGSVEVNHLEQEENNGLTIGRNQREYEFARDVSLDPPYPDTFEDFELGLEDFYNDTFDTAQMLGSIASSELGRSEVVRVEGQLQAVSNRVDGSDFYGVSLMAGQTYRARLEQFVGVIFNIPLDELPTDYDPTVPRMITPVPTLHLFVIDPDGRLVASDLVSNAFATGGNLVSFKADRPGIYRFAVSGSGDLPADATSPGTADYRLTVFNVGDIALGGLYSAGDWTTLNGTGSSHAGVTLFRGDFGSIRAGGTISHGATAGGGQLVDLATDSDVDVTVNLGNLRAIDGGSLGSEGPSGGVAGGPTVDVPEGGIGLIRARDAGHFQADGSSVEGNGAPVPALDFNVNNPREIGGNIQLIDGSAVTVSVEIHTRKSLGVVRAGDLLNPAGPSIFEVDSDNRNRDGIIDLLETAGTFGGLDVGGPQIITHEGGNVRYIRTGGTIYQDQFYSAGSPTETLFNPGDDASFTDDSGATLKFHAIGELTPNPLFEPNNPNSTASEFIGPSMRIITYGIRGISGGVVVVNVQSEGGLDISSSGETAEIGRVEFNGVGQGVVIGRSLFGESEPEGVFGAVSQNGSNQPIPTLALSAFDGAGGGAAVPLELRVHGSARVDVLNVFAGAGGTANATSIVNTTTDGEFLNVAAGSIGTLSADGPLAVARNHTGMDILGISNLAMPGLGTAISDVGQVYEGSKNGIVVAGNLGEVRSKKEIGNVAVDGTIGEIVPNADGIDDPSRFEGIVGVISAYSSGDGPLGSGRILHTNIGEGIAPSGTGRVQFTGVFAFYSLGPITGQNADIRGDILSKQANSSEGESISAGNDAGVEPTVAPGTGTGTDAVIVRPSPNAALATDPIFRLLSGAPAVAINRISLVDGSIIQSEVIVGSDRRNVLNVGRVGIVGSDTNDTIKSPQFNLGPVNVAGNGGIIGSIFTAPDIARISVRDGGFGIFTTFVNFAFGDGVLGGIDATGYGLRSVEIRGGAAVGSIVARGDGTSLSTNAVNPRVRYAELPITDSDVGVIDPFFGVNPTPLTDIHSYLGTIQLDAKGQPTAHPEMSGVTDTGVIEAVNARSSRSLESVSAYQIRAGGIFSSLLNASNFNVARLRSTFSFANSIGSISTRDIVNGMEVVTGALKSFTPGSDVFALDFGVRGRAKKIDIKGSLGGNSVIHTDGQSGRIDNLNIAGNLIGDISSAKAIKSINIGGDFTGDVVVTSGGTAIKTLKVGGTFIAGSLSVTGNVGTIQSAGSLGSLGDTLLVNGNLNKLAVGGDLRANVRVTGNLKNITVNGSIVDGGIEDGLIIDVSKAISSLNVGGDIQPGVQINAKSIKKQNVGGQNFGEINIVA